MKTDIIDELTWRGLIYQTTDPEMAKWLNGGSRTLYAGFDPTADSLHVGSLLPLTTLRRFQKAGHRPIALVGGATGMIGDPSGKSAERNLLSEDALHQNVAGIERQMRSLLDFESSSNAAVVVNNHDWIGKFSYVEFLRDVGKNFSVNMMLAKDSVKSRIEGDTGISYTEFSYMLLQAFDFVHLNRTYGCELQVGGSDQWGNITAGIDLGRRMNSAQLFGITCPLLTKSDGSKMGKTETGTVWLSSERTSPFKFYQYWIRVDDADTSKCLRYLTELDREEIEALDRSRETEPHLRESQKKLAETLTKTIHGERGLETALKATAVLYGEAFENLAETDLLSIFEDVPSKTLSRGLLADDGLLLIDALTESELTKSKGESRRAISEGGVYVNNRRVDDANFRLKVASLASETCVVLRRGKKNYAIIRFE